MDECGREETERRHFKVEEGEGGLFGDQRERERERERERWGCQGGVAYSSGGMKSGGGGGGEHGGDYGNGAEAVDGKAIGGRGGH